MDRKKVVILFSRLSDYMLNVYNLWVSTSNVELYIIRKAVDKKEAPFEFSNKYQNMYFYDRENFTNINLLKKIINIKPDLILCSGWSDKGYLTIVTHYKKNIPTVMSMDNQWIGTPKQKLATLLAPLMLTSKFSHIWVPGEPQKIYAKKLGFKKEQIYTDFYVANSNNFLLDKINPTHKISKRFIFVGRYIEIKGLKELWKAFIEIQNEIPNEWELLCIGAGKLYDYKSTHPKIKHLGFIQPNELKDYMKDGGVFVLPSHFEPWGVVVHEFALAGFPMIVSDSVGASTQFIDEGKNGFIFKAKDSLELKKKMKKIIFSSNKELKEMGYLSYKKGKKVTEEKWVNTANKLIGI